MTAGGRRSAAETLLGLCLVLVFAVLCFAAIDRMSLSGDGAYHLLAGDQALRRGQNLVNLEHPPLAKLVMAAPGLWMESPWPEIVPPERALASLAALHEDPSTLRRRTALARWAVLLVFSLPWLWLCGRLAGKLPDPSDRRCAQWLLPALLAGTFWIFPNLVLLQTDAAVSCAYALAMVGMVNYLRGPRLRGALVLGAALGLGLAVKFSAVLLGPPVVVALLVAPGSWRRRAAHLLAALGVTVALIHAAYGFANWNYDRPAARAALEAHCEGRATVLVEDRLEPWLPTILAVERFDPPAAQWLAGFLGVWAQQSLGVYPAYAFGMIDSDGWWWYFPALLAIKTPLVLLAAFGWMAWVRIRRRGLASPGPAGQGAAVERRLRGVLTFTAGLYLLAALTSSYNIGLRHLLPVLPLLYMPLARQLAARRRGWGIGVVAALVLELTLLTPLWMGATNTWWLGEHNPSRFAFSASNLEYRLNLPELEAEARRRDIKTLRVIYPGLEREVLRAYVPRAVPVVPEQPLAPGWYAVNIVAEQFAPVLLTTGRDELPGRPGLYRAARRWKPVLDQLEAGEDHGYIAGTFHLIFVAEENATGSPS